MLLIYMFFAAVGAMFLSHAAAMSLAGGLPDYLTTTEQINFAITTWGTGIAIIAMAIIAAVREWGK